MVTPQRMYSTAHRSSSYTFELFRLGWNTVFVATESLVFRLFKGQNCKPSYPRLSTIVENKNENLSFPHILWYVLICSGFSSLHITLTCHRTHPRMSFSLVLCNSFNTVACCQLRDWMCTSGLPNRRPVVDFYLAPLCVFCWCCWAWL
jgi:hypothetical protein